MKRMSTILVVILLAGTLPGLAAAQQLFDFFGMANLPAAEGGSLSMFGVIRDGGAAVATPLPLDFANYEYTIVVEDLVLVTDDYPETYAGGTITIYRDASSTADYAATGTFSDGTAVLSGVVSSLELFHYSDLVPSATGGSGIGTVDWTGGARLDEIAPGDQDGWGFFTATNSGSGLLEPGYDEVWDGKVEPATPIVGTERMSWGAVKAMY